MTFPLSLVWAAGRLERHSCSRGPQCVGNGHRVLGAELNSNSEEVRGVAPADQRHKCHFFGHSRATANASPCPEWWHLRRLPADSPFLPLESARARSEER